MAEEKKSIFQRAGEWGIPFGLYLACGGVLAIFVDCFTPLSVILMLMMLATPAVVYYFQRRKFIEDDGFTEYAGLWMLGIMLFILGAVLACFIVYLVAQYCRPDYMYQQAERIIEIYKQVPEMRDSEMLNIIQSMVDKRMMPSPIEAVFNSFWFITFLGSVTSALTALIAQRPLKRYRRR